MDVVFCVSAAARDDFFDWPTVARVGGQTEKKSRLYLFLRNWLLTCLDSIALGSPLLEFSTSCSNGQ